MPRSRTQWLLAPLFVAAMNLAPVSSVAARTTDARPTARTLYFSHRDEALLVAGQSRSSVAYVPNVCGGAPLPVLVLLHGINESRTLYPWFGGTYDLRPTFDTLAPVSSRRFVVAAPTQTKDAWVASTMWSEFRLLQFLDDLAAALPPGCEIDRDAVILAGHSAAGCNPEGGLATSIDPGSAFSLKGLAFIDTCFDVRVAAQLATRRSTTKIWVLWQKQTWPRDPQAFVDRLNVPGRSPVAVTEVPSTFVNAHIGAMYSAVEEIVRTWIFDAMIVPTPTDRSELRPPEASTQRMEAGQAAAD